MSFCILFLSSNVPLKMSSFISTISSRLFAFPLLCQLADLIVADICLPSIGQEDNLLAIPRLAKPSKQCPDFKDGPEQTACCPSQVSSGAFFCCTEEHKTELEAQLASDARRRFLSSHVPELVLCSLVLLLLLFLLCSFLCRRTRFCPLLHSRRKSSGGGSRHSLNSNSNGSTGRPLHQSQRLNRLQIRSAYQFSRQQQAEAPLFNSALRKQQYDAPPPYSLAIASAPLPTNDVQLEEEHQNRLNAQREQRSSNGVEEPAMTERNL